MMVRWLYSDTDERAHVLDENSAPGSRTVITICQQVLPDTIPVHQTAPSMNLCPRCEIYAAVPPPEHPTRPQFPAGTKKYHRDEGHHDPPPGE
ncbi:MAG: hypothetical protein ACRDTC_23075 [Pseudonocardiaceae bacterium]